MLSLDDMQAVCNLLAQHTEAHLDLLQSFGLEIGTIFNVDLAMPAGYPEAFHDIVAGFTSEPSSEALWREMYEAFHAINAIVALVFTRYSQLVCDV